MTVDLEWLFDRFPDGVAVVGDSGRILFANRAASSIFGFPDLTGMAMDALIPQASGEEYLELFKNSPAPGASGLVDRRPLRLHAQRADGTVLELEVTVTVTDIGERTPVLVTSFRVAQDPSSLDRPQEIVHYLDLVVELTEQLASLKTDAEAYAAILPTLCRALQRDVACLWVVTADGHHLRCAATWPDDGGPTQTFEDVSKKLFLSYGEGIPGSAWSSGRPLVSSAGHGQMTLPRQSAIRQTGLRAGQVGAPSELIDALRRSWDLLGFERGATALFGRIDPRDGQMILSSAGHLPPAVVGPAGKPYFVDVTPSPPLGAPGGPATDHRMVLDRGAMLLFYTDGLIEEREVSISARLARLLRVLEGARADSAIELCQMVLDQFWPTKHPRDDVAVLVGNRH
jgi:PAS domain S-box-containing protein